MASHQPPASGVSKRAIAIAVAVALLVAGVLVAISAAGGSDEKTTQSVAFGPDVTALFAGIPQQGDRLGNADAPVEIIEYADLQCPFCAQAAANVVPQLITRYVKPGRARLTFRPLAFIGPDSERGALAAIAAGDQGKMWTFTELAYRNQGAENAGWLSEGFVRGAAGAIALDAGALDAGRKSGAAKDALAAAAAKAERDGVNSTPTFIVSGPKGRVVIQDSSKIDEIAAAVDGLG